MSTWTADRSQNDGYAWSSILRTGLSNNSRAELPLLQTYLEEGLEKDYFFFAAGEALESEAASVDGGVVLGERIEIFCRMIRAKKEMIIQNETSIAKSVNLNSSGWKVIVSRQIRG